MSYKQKNIFFRLSIKVVPVHFVLYLPILEPRTGKRTRGKQYKRWKDDIDNTEGKLWTGTALDRGVGRNLCQKPQTKTTEVAGNNQSY